MGGSGLQTRTWEDFMGSADVYRELSKKLMMENSRILPRLWSAVCTPEEAEIVNMMPGTAEDLAGRSGRSLEETQRLLDKLFHRGAAFDAMKDGKRVYRMPRHILQFHDATILWREAPGEFIDLWAEFMDAEYPELVKLAAQVKLPAFMRVIPVNETIEAKSQVLAYEDAVKMIEDATNIAVVDCTCRKSHRRCDAPVEVCLQINRGADYTERRGTGRKVDKEEAIAILGKAQDAGLVHATENKGGTLNVICSCCRCCCEMLRFASDPRTRSIVAPSRFQAFVTEAECTSCGKCVEVCPVGAVSMGANDIAGVGDACLGCGLCAHHCPALAINLKEVRPESFIPA
jgi:Pyruvate/2-oxoacid:ferredoxin oxidoreductase delta subunit